MIQTFNPATGAPLPDLAEHTPAEVEARLARAATAQRDWRRRPLAERADALREVARVLRSRRTELAGLITLEMGKVVTEAEGEVEKSAFNCEHYAAHAQAVIGDEVVPSNASDSRVVYDPLGLVLAVMPWNFPVWQVMRFAAPALLAGNGAVLKHANNVPQCALALESVFREAGLPEGLFTTVLVGSARVKALIEDPRIAAVTLTGSTPVGRLVAAQAGAVLKKQVLELGGSDPFIVLADADVELAARTAVKARFHNAGQSCVCAKRFIVEAAVADRFVEVMAETARALVVGDPTRRETAMGPMARHDLRAGLHAQVARSQAQGARTVLGGVALEGPGAYYAPTLLDHVSAEMAVGAEETFGPVAAVMRVADADAAIALANATEFGLGAALWTTDLDRARRLSREIEAGAVFINGLVASDPRLPFGGVKQSGYGRELGVHGIREFTNVKTVWTGPAR